MVDKTPAILISIGIRITIRSMGETKMLASRVQNDVKPLHKCVSEDKVQPGNGLSDALHDEVDVVTRAAYGCVHHPGPDLGVRGQLV